MQRADNTFAMIVVALVLCTAAMHLGCKSAFPALGATLTVPFWKDAVLFQNLGNPTVASTQDLSEVALPLSSIHANTSCWYISVTSHVLHFVILLALLRGWPLVDTTELPPLAHNPGVESSCHVTIAVTTSPR